MTDRTDRLCCTVEDIKALRGHMQGVTDADCEVLALAFNSLASAALPVFLAFASLADVLRNTLASLAALPPEQRAQLEAWLEGGTPVTDLIHVGVTLEAMHAEDCDSYNGTGGKVCTCSCGAPLYHGGRICRDCAEQECP